jgi:hypothetical protein
VSQTIASLIPAAIGIAIRPVPIVELILVIFSRKQPQARTSTNRNPAPLLRC